MRRKRGHLASVVYRVSRNNSREPLGYIWLPVRFVRSAEDGGGGIGWRLVGLRPFGAAACSELGVRKIVRCAVGNVTHDGIVYKIPGSPRIGFPSGLGVGK